ncbi:hypothetical protein [Nocardiopsis sp. LOL_012]|uniref:hypothetical protein n=1 Tax=Nocardiopsis sp. LOL_012 TaxID=3345409 RepID=UPI003A88739A
MPVSRNHTATHGDPFDLDLIVNVPVVDDLTRSATHDDPDCGLLEGAAGTVLALTTAAFGPALSRWDGCLAI